MGRLDGTQIGADGKRHPIGEGPKDPSPFRVKHRSVDVAGVAREAERSAAGEQLAALAGAGARIGADAELHVHVDPDEITGGDRGEIELPNEITLPSWDEVRSEFPQIEPDVFFDASVTPEPGSGGGHIESLPLLAESGQAQQDLDQAIRDLAEIEAEPTEVEPVPEGEITLTDTTEELPAGPVATALGDDYSDYEQEETPDAP